MSDPPLTDDDWLGHWVPGAFIMLFSASTTWSALQRFARGACQGPPCPSPAHLRGAGVAFVVSMLLCIIQEGSQNQRFFDFSFSMQTFHQVRYALGTPLGLAMAAEGFGRAREGVHKPWHALVSATFTVLAAHHIHMFGTEAETAAHAAATVIIAIATALMIGACCFAGRPRLHLAAYAAPVSFGVWYVAIGLLIYSPWCVVPYQSASRAPWTCLLAARQPNHSQGVAVGAAAAVLSTLSAAGCAVAIAMGWRALVVRKLQYTGVVVSRTITTAAEDGLERSQR